MMENVTLLNTSNYPNDGLSLYQIFVGLGGLAGMASLIWNIKNTRPQIKVSAHEGLYYSKESSTIMDRVIIISIINRGKVQIKIDSCGFIILNGKDKIEILDNYPSRQLISGERHNQYFTTKQLTDRILQFPGIMIDFGDSIPIRAICKDQSGRIFYNKTFKFNTRSSESTLPKLRFLGGSVPIGGSSISTRKCWRIFHGWQFLKRQWLEYFHPDLYRQRIEDLRERVQQKHGKESLEKKSIKKNY